MEVTEASSGARSSENTTSARSWSRVARIGGDIVYLDLITTSSNVTIKLSQHSGYLVTQGLEVTGESWSGLGEEMSACVTNMLGKTGINLQQPLLGNKILGDR